MKYTGSSIVTTVICYFGVGFILFFLYLSTMGIFNYIVNM